MTSNLLHALRPRQVHVTLLGRSWELVGHTAADWIGGIGWDLEQLLGVMPGMLHPDQLWDLLELSWGREDFDQRLLRCAQAAIGRASGREWVWAYNLSRKCLQGWPYFNGALLGRGVRADQVHFGDWLDAAYMLLWERSDESDRKALDFELLLPPKHMAAAAPMSSQATRKMLEAFAAD